MRCTQTAALKLNIQSQISLAREYILAPPYAERGKSIQIKSFSH